ncbi:MAG: hypothetical protein FWG87_00020 [Defluviitaleaceae bacterium]|nr:hypothetical protein [Defluviitaleaceae bacterium]
MCFGRSVSHSGTSIIAIETVMFSSISSRFEGSAKEPSFIKNLLNSNNRFANQKY